MFNDTTTTESTSPYIKSPSIPGLYRHLKSGRYYAAMKMNGKRREHSLRTKDRQIAERRQRDWVAGLRIVDREVERTTFSQLVDSFLAANRGKSTQTQTRNARSIGAVLEMCCGAVNMTPTISGV